jgi:integrase
MNEPQRLNSGAAPREGSSDLELSRDLCNQLHNHSADRVAFYLGASRAGATHRAYAADLAAFAAWGGQIPATPELVAAYLATSDMLAPSTLRRRLAALADAHQAGGHPDPTKDILVRKVFRGICRTRGTASEAAAPLDVSMLAQIIDVIPDDLGGLRDRALLLVGFFCALRRAELVGLEVQDLLQLNDLKSIRIRRSKTDQTGGGHTVALPSLSNLLCPVSALEAWMAGSAHAAGPVFRSIGKAGQVLATAVPAQEVGRILRLRAAAAGINPDRLSAHSLRSGFAVSAVRAGISLPLIQAVTRHATLAGLEPYVREAGAPTIQQMASMTAHGSKFGHSTHDPD